jgi:phage terminase large subunit
MEKVRINPKFRPLYRSQKRYFLVTGGRGSGKTFAVIDALIRLTTEQGHGILFTRYTMTSAEKSIIPLFKQQINAYALEDMFHITKSQITNTYTGSFIIFSGIKTSSGDQTANLKSLPNITTFVVEEGEDFNDQERFEEIEDSVRIANVQNRIIWIQNPTNKDHFAFKKWIQPKNKTIDIDGSQVLVGDLDEVEYIHTSYLDNLDNLNSQFLDKIRRDKTERPERYKRKYLGQWQDKAEGVIFTNWEEGAFDESLPYCYGQDYGYSNDPTTLIKVAFDKKAGKVYLKECFYIERPLGTAEIAELNKAHIDNKNDLIVGDSAEQRLIDEIAQYQVNMMQSEKGPGSVREGISSLLDHQIIVHPDSFNLKTELNNYIWNDKKAGLPLSNNSIIPRCFSVGKNS